MLLLSKKKTLKFFCEDCSHLFIKEMTDDLDPDNMLCPQCGSEFVNSELDRSLFERLGMPELDKCSPSDCRSCMYRCELFDDNNEDKDKNDDGS